MAGVRAKQLKQFADCAALENSRNEKDQDIFVFDFFEISIGCDAIAEMVIFKLLEIEFLNKKFSRHVCLVWNSGNGKKNKVSSYGALL